MGFGSSIEFLRLLIAYVLSKNCERLLNEETSIIKGCYSFDKKKKLIMIIDNVK